MQMLTLLLSLVFALPQDSQLRKPDVIYVPTPPAVVEAMLKMANVSGSDVVYDLGCGDGRIPIAAAQKYGARGVGIDIDPVRIAEAIENAKTAGVTGKVTFLNQDLFTSDDNTDPNPRFGQGTTFAAPRRFFISGILAF